MKIELTTDEYSQLIIAIVGNQQELNERLRLFDENVVKHK